eukprot:3047927-Amphidinium_carterae.1
MRDRTTRLSELGDAGALSALDCTCCDCSGVVAAWSVSSWSCMRCLLLFCMLYRAPQPPELPLISLHGFTSAFTCQLIRCPCKLHAPETLCALRSQCVYHVLRFCLGEVLVNVRLCWSGVSRSRRTSRVFARTAHAR